MKIENGKVYFDHDDAKHIADEILDMAIAEKDSPSWPEIQMGNGVVVTLGYVGFDFTYDYDPGTEFYPECSGDLRYCECQGIEEMYVNKDDEECEYEAYPYFLQDVRDMAKCAA